MEIAPVLYRDHIEVYVKNTSSRELHLWDLSNSWGYWSISFEVRDERDKTIYTVVPRSDTEFTMNGPNSVAITPGERHAFYIDVGDGWWERDEALLLLGNTSLSIRAIYKVDPTPEANEFGVFVGSVSSNWVTSTPPHDWLFTQEPNWEEIAGRLKHRTPYDVLYIFSREIETKARLIELNAMLIHEDQNAASTVLENMSSATAVGDVLNDILEYTAQIRKIIQEKQVYINIKPREG